VEAAGESARAAVDALLKATVPRFCCFAPIARSIRERVNKSFTRIERLKGGEWRNALVFGRRCPSGNFLALRRMGMERAPSRVKKATPRVEGCHDHSANRS